MQIPIHVEVYEYSRKTAGETFAKTRKSGYDAIIDDETADQLPMAILKKDRDGNTIHFVACEVRVASPGLVGVSEEAAKPVKRTTKAKATPVVSSTPEPSVPKSTRKTKTVATPAPAPVPAPKRSVPVSTVEPKTPTVTKRTKKQEDARVKAILDALTL